MFDFDIECCLVVFELIGCDGIVDYLVLLCVLIENEFDVVVKVCKIVFDLLLIVCFDDDFVVCIVVIDVLVGEVSVEVCVVMN